MDKEKREQFIKTVTDFISMTAICLPDDIQAAVLRLAVSETKESAKTMYGCILDDIELAGKLRRPLCQDTGVLQFFAEVGTGFPYMDDLKDVLLAASERATMQTPLRPNVVEPLGEHNTGNNVGYGAPYIEYDLKPKSSDLRLRMYMAGGGCSLPGRSKVLMPLEGLQGVKRFVYETVVEWGVNACPPLFLGIGLGTCAATSAELSKKALLRPAGSHNEDPRIAALETEMETELNHIGIAPLGFGGSSSVLGVNIECAGHHPATLGVGISTGCWATRRGEIVIHSDLSCEIISHRNSEGILRGTSAALQSNEQI